MLFKWVKGRQGTGYEKMKLFELGIPSLGGFDGYILRYKVGDSIPIHVDPVTGKKHYRLNVVVCNAKEGGKLLVENPIFSTSRICIFRSDLSKHAVEEVKEGSRIVLSFGMAF